MTKKKREQKLKQPLIKRMLVLPGIDDKGVSLLRESPYGDISFVSCDEEGRAFLENYSYDIIIIPPRCECPISAETLLKKYIYDSIIVFVGNPVDRASIDTRVLLSSKFAIKEYPIEEIIAIIGSCGDEMANTYIKGNNHGNVKGR